MADKTASRTVTVLNEQGVHLRPADLFVRLAKRFESQVEVLKDGQCVDGKSILDMITLSAVKGSKLIIRTTGPDAEQALDALVDLFQRKFDQPQDNEQQTADQQQA